MKKIFSFMLIAAGLMISAQSKAQETYPNAWITSCVKDAPVITGDWDHSYYTFHCFNPDNGDAAIFQKFKTAPGTLTDADITRIKEVLLQINPNYDVEHFSLATFDPKHIGGYADWKADFMIYFDQDMAADEYKIAGQYDKWSANWVDASIDEKSAEQFSLLGQIGSTMKYWEFVDAIPQFNCGITGLDEERNAGKTIHVCLYIYNPNDSTDKKLISHTSYTFPVRPIVPANEVVETPENAYVLGQLKAENGAIKDMTLDETNIYPATVGYMDDSSKCVIVILTDIQISIEGETYKDKLQKVTYNVTPKYRDSKGVLHTIPNSAIKEPITFRLPIIKEYAGSMVQVYHKATDASVEDYVGLYPVKEYTNEDQSKSYYVELSAKEFSKYIIKKAINYYERETTPGMIGTICVPYDIVPDSVSKTKNGAEFFEINYRNNEVITAVTEVEGVKVDSLIGGRAYVFIADSTSGRVHVGWTPELSLQPKEVVAGTMVGNLAAAPIKPATLYAAGTCEPYIVTTEGIFRPCGPDATVPMNRAYLNMAVVPTTKDSSAPGRRIRLTSNGAQVVTGMENVNANANVNRKMMVNGQLVIIRDGKMFNAQGQKL